VVAFNPFHDQSLFVGFGASVLLLLFAAILIRRRVAAPMIAGISAVGILAHYESARIGGWLFSGRHALLLLFALTASFVIVATEGQKALRVVAGILVAISILTGLKAIVETPIPAGTGPTQGERDMIRWLTAHAPRATIMTTNAQRLSVYTRNPIQWANCTSTPAEMRRLIPLLQVQYVAVYEHERRCSFAGALTRAEGTFGEPGATITLYRE